MQLILRRIRMAWNAFWFRSYIAAGDYRRAARRKRKLDNDRFY